MNKRKQYIIFLLVFFSLILALAGCVGKEDKYDRLAREKNEELNLEPLQLTDYGDEVGLKISDPEYELFAVNGKVEVRGNIAGYKKLKTNYVWIKVANRGGGPAGTGLEYYAPIQNGDFQQTIHFFNGEGEYKVTVYVPDKQRENYYYVGAEFEVINVNPEAKRDLAYTPAGQEAGLSIDVESGFVTENGRFILKGNAEKLANETMMIYLRKDGDSWKHVIPVEDGKFKYEVPLYFGKGVHSLEVLIPDPNRKNYYQPAISILIDNESEEKREPIEYFGDLYITRGVHLKNPVYGGIEAGDSVRIAGTIDPEAEFAGETTHLYITTKKGKDEALDVIPVENYSFDSSTYLRFGPGEYEVIVSVPEIKEGNRDYFRFFSVAKFKVHSSVEADKRDILPSRGVQSDDPQIMNLANSLTKDLSTDLEKAKAIYEYVAKNISYDVAKMKNNEFAWDDSALKTLEKKSGVCQDYAYLTIALLRASGIEARFVEGRAGGENAFGIAFAERHAWVEAKIDGRWLTMDPTWGAGYIQNGSFVSSYTEKYFDPNPAEFEKTHKRTKVNY